MALRGFTVFARFEEKTGYAGLSLAKLREAGITEDARIFKPLRVLFRYKPEKVSKWKGALIQAVEAVDRYLAAQAAEEPFPVTANKFAAPKAAKADIVPGIGGAPPVSPDGTAAGEIFAGESGDAF
jgi:hypothetical protein